jgi:copper chaperone CopZ
MAQTFTYRVPDMSTGHCKAAVAEQLHQVPSVDSFDIDLEDHLVTIHGTAIDGKAVIAAIDEAGYEAVPIRSRNLAGRIGAWSATHRRAAILSWIAFVILAIAIGSMAGMRMLTPADEQAGESARAAHVIDGTPMGHMASESVLIQSRRYRFADLRFRAAVATLRARSRRSRASRTCRRRGPRVTTQWCRRTAIRRWCSSSSTER